MLLSTILFLLTAATTTVTGAIYAEMWYVHDPTDSWVLYFLRGWIFSVPIMLILVVHEMGHYLAGIRRRLDVTLPYFIPGIYPLGTFGAFIKIRSPITDRNVLMEVGAWGPLAGSMVAIPLLVLGAYLSRVGPPVETAYPTVHFGTSVISELVNLIRFGDLTHNIQVQWHPAATAARFGLFVTAMNLLPMGQLDGGHVIYALFGPRHARRLSLGVLFCLIPLGFFYWLGWLVFATLVAYLGLRHPPPLDPYTPLRKGAKLLGWCAIVLFILTFIPEPIIVME